MYCPDNRLSPYDYPMEYCRICNSNVEGLSKFQGVEMCEDCEMEACNEQEAAELAIEAAQMAEDLKNEAMNDSFNEA